AAVSGERKEHVLQSRRGLSSMRAKLIERPDTAHASVRKQHEAITDTLGVAQLMDGEDERASSGGGFAQHVHDLARLSQIEAVERLIHQQQLMGGEERERQHEPAA